MAPAQDRFKIASDILRAADPTERKVQQKLIEEQVEIFGASGQSTEVTTSHMSK